MRAWQFIILEQILACSYPVYAHTNKERPRETLEAHTVLCQKYYMEMYERRKLGVFLKKVVEMLTSEPEDVFLGLFYEMLDNVIAFHDTGKMNPAFQRLHMDNEIPGLRSVDWIAGANHSLFSAVIYLLYFMEHIDRCELDKESKRRLRGICLMNAFVISRHHSSMGRISSFISEFEPGGAGDAIIEGLMPEKHFLKDLVCVKKRQFKTVWKNFRNGCSREQGIALYSYTRFLYSLLVSCDYYATTEYNSGVAIHDFGDMDECQEFNELYENTGLTQGIRAYQKGILKLDGMNQLRNELFLETERNLKKNPESAVYFLEAPTGSGKSNVSMNLSFQLLKEGYQKIYYVYPFNTLVDQNLESLERIFGKGSDALQKITVLNSNTPIKHNVSKEKEELMDEDYIKALLDRQFLNYPFVLTTHVSLFHTMFGENREAAFGFSQLKDSVIILDEIQSYKNTIWSEIMIFLKSFAKLLNMKIFIMSATLPDLNYLTDESGGVVRLLENRDRYFMHSTFKERVQVSYELLHQEIDLEILRDHILKHSKENNKVVIEFIKKKRAYEFHELLENDERVKVPLYLITGDDNLADRAQKLQEIKEGNGLILVATQVIEAGVDIDMDIGYKDISKLDSEEQFLGRINRSNNGEGIAYFFHLDDAKKVYTDGDLRVNTEFTLIHEEMQEILKSKDFAPYYQVVLQCLKENLNQSLNDERNLMKFFDDSVKALDFPEVSKRMRLIEDSEWSMSVFLARNIEVRGKKLNGKDIWKEYKELLQDFKMSYSEKQVKLSDVRSRMNYFIYQIKKTQNLIYSKRIGELYYIEDGDEYFKDGRLDRETLEQGKAFL